MEERPACGSQAAQRTEKGEKVAEADLSGGLIGLAVGQYNTPIE